MKEKSRWALCALEIRKELKDNFKDIKFEVKSETYAGGDIVRVNWVNGPTTDAVDAIIRKYQYGHFDGMTDYYDISNKRNDINQVKYVFAHRKVTDDIVLSAAKAAHDHYGGMEKIKAPTLETLGDNFVFNGEWFNWYQFTYRILVNFDLTNVVGIIEDPDFKCGSMYAGFKAVFA